MPAPEPTIRKSSTTGTPQLSSTLTYKRVQAIPSLGLPALRRNHSAGSRSISTIDSQKTPSEKAAKARVPLDEPCFVSKTPGYALARAYLVQPPDEERTGQDSKAGVEKFLSDCHIVPPNYNLHSLSNIITLERTLHYTFEKFGFIAITCSKDTLSAILAVVQEENKKFDQLEGMYYRRFDLLSPPFSTASYELVVLHPEHFLPQGSVVLMHTVIPDPDANSTEGAAPAYRLQSKAYMIATDGALREGYDASSARFGVFTSSNPSDDTPNQLFSSRAPADQPNPLLLVLNAATAFRRFRQQGGPDNTEKLKLCEEYAELVDLTLQVAEALMHERVTRAATHAYVKDDSEWDGSELEGSGSEEGSAEDGSDSTPR